MLKIRIILLILVFLISVLIVGCGKKEKKTADNSKTVVTVACGSVGNELELTANAIKLYQEKNPDVEVKLLETPDLAQERLILYLQFLEAKSTDVDVFQIDIIWTGDLAEHLVDLNKYGAKKTAPQHYDSIIKNNTVKGKLVAIPWFTDAGLLYYRKDLLKKYKLKLPETWEQLELAAKRIQVGERASGNRDFWGYIWQGDAYEGLTCNALEWIFSNGGGRIISSDKKITINNSNAIEIIKRAANWVGAISPPGVTGMSEERARNMWQAGNAAFMRNWPYAYTLGNTDDSAIRGKFDVAPLPAGKSGIGAATLGGWQLAVSKYSKNPAIAADIALFLASYDIQKMRAIDGSLNPTIKKIYKDKTVLKANPFLANLGDVFLNAVARPSTATSPDYNNVSQLFYRAVYSVLVGKRDAATAMENLEMDLKELTGFTTGRP